MRLPEDQVEELKKLFPGVQSAEEGGLEYFLIPKLLLQEDCAPSQVDVLLCPMRRDGYPSRLYFAERIQSSGNPNWHASTFFILERNWHVYSFNTNCETIRLAQMVAEHLRGLL